MKLTHFQYFKPININPDCPKRLVIEDSVYYRKIVTDLLEQNDTGDGEFILTDDKDKMCEISKYCLIITDIFNYINLEKQIKTKLNSIITSEYQNKEITNDLILKINTFGISVMNSYMYPVKFKDTLTIQDVIKAMDFAIDLSDLNFIEKFIEYIKICFELFDYKMLITLNLSEVISEKEYGLLMEDLQNRRIPILMIERNLNKELKMNEWTTIIDKDLCVL